MGNLTELHFLKSELSSSLNTQGSTIWVLEQILTGYILNYVKGFFMLDIKSREWWFVTNKLNNHFKIEKELTKRRHSRLGTK